jgi:hypothetical protein
MDYTPQGYMYHLAFANSGGRNAPVSMLSPKTQMAEIANLGGAEPMAHAMTAYVTFCYSTYQPITIP